MKSLVILFTLFICGSALAEIKPEGTFVPSLCAQDIQSDSGVVSVCYGEKVGSENLWIELHLVRDGKSDSIELLVNKTTKVGPGPGRGLHSVEIDVTYMGDIGGKLFGTTSLRGPQSLNGNLSGIQFKASNFEFVAVTM